MKTSFLLALACLGAAVLPTAQAATYPDKPIKIIVPYPPAGFNDSMARIVGRKLQEAWGQPVVVENRPGGSTIIGTEAGARAAPDGYTLTVVGFPAATNPYLYKKLPYDAIKDFAPIIAVAQTPNLLVVNAASPVKTIKDLVALAKSKPGALNYASTTGTSNHLTMEYFKSVAGVDMTQVPYKGSAPMVVDLLGGQVDVMFDNLPNVLPHVTGGKMRALAITSPKRSALAPDIPTVAESGWPGFDVSVWYALAAPANTPAAIITKLNTEINKILLMDDVKKIFAEQGVEPMGGTPEQYAEFSKAQTVKWSKVIGAANIKAE